MKSQIILLALLVLLSGCTQAPPPQSNNTTSTPSCSEYCASAPHPSCAGSWNISGAYPSCKCDFVCANSTNSTSQPPPQKTVEINMTAKRFEYDPGSINVTKGDHVVIHISVPADDVRHGFALPDFGLNQMIEPGSNVTVEFDANKSGSFDFFCSVPCGAGHYGMRGTLVVK